VQNRKSEAIISTYSGSYTTETEQVEFERETGILLDKEAIERARAEERKQSYLNHMKKVLEYMASHNGKTPPDTFGPLGRKLYAVRHALKNQMLMDDNKPPMTARRIPEDIAKLYLIGDPEGVGRIWLNRDENGKIEPPEITLDKIDKGEIYR